MAVALRQVHSTALEVWMSMGFTIALYLKLIKMQMQIKRYSNSTCDAQAYFISLIKIMSCFSYLKCQGACNHS